MSGIAGLRREVVRLDRELSAAAAAINADAARRIAELYVAGSERRGRLVVAIALSGPEGDRWLAGDTAKHRPARTPAVDLVIGMLASFPEGRSTRELTAACVGEGWSGSSAQKAVERMRDSGYVEGGRRSWRLTPAGRERASTADLRAMDAPRSRGDRVDFESA